MQEIAAPRGIVSGTAVIRDAAGNIKGTFEFRSEGTVPLDKVGEVLGAPAAAQMRTVIEGEG